MEIKGAELGEDSRKVEGVGYPTSVVEAAEWPRW